METDLDPSPTLLELLPSWERSLRARRKAERTVESYLYSAKKFIDYLELVGMPTKARHISKEHVEAFIVREIERTSPGNANTDFGRLQQLFAWASDEGEIVRSPMLTMKRPDVVQQPPAVIPDDDLRALLRACEPARGTRAPVGSMAAFVARRDVALIRLLFDTGMRRSELAGLTLDDIQWKYEVAVVTGKGGKIRACPLSPKTIEALDRYVRARRLHPSVHEPWLWLGKKGRLTGSGIAQMLERRETDAGLTDIYPHRFRHTAAHDWLAHGGSESDLMQLMGWTSSEMPRRYGASAANERAREAHRRRRPGDRI